MVSGETGAVQTQHLEVLGRKLLAWLSSERGRIPALEDEMGHIGRVSDMWSPLYVVAQLAGGEWPDVFWESCKALTNKSKTAKINTSYELLSGIVSVLDGEDKIFTVELIDRLCRIESSRWADYNFKAPEDRRRISDRQLSGLLSIYDSIEPKTVRIGGTVQKGYDTKPIHEAFRRYTPRTSVTSVTSSVYAASARCNALQIPKM